MSLTHDCSGTHLRETIHGHVGDDLPEPMLVDTKLIMGKC